MVSVNAVRVESTKRGVEQHKERAPPDKKGGAAIAEGDFFGMPGGGLVELVGLRLGSGPRLVEPVQIRFVIGNPFLDRLPRWLDGLMV